MTDLVGKLVDWNEDNKYQQKEWGKGPFRVIALLGGDLIQVRTIDKPSRVPLGFYSWRFDVLPEKIIPYEEML